MKERWTARTVVTTSERLDAAHARGHAAREASALLAHQRAVAAHAEVRALLERARLERIGAQASGGKP